MRTRHLLLVVLIVFSSGMALADGVNPDEPIEYLPFRAGNKIFPDITPTASYNPSSDSFTFHYDIFFQPHSEQPLFSVDFLVDLDETDYLNGETTAGCHIHHYPESLIHSSVPPSVTIITDNDLSFGPGTRLEDTVFSCLGLPGVIESYTKGDVPPPSGQQVVLPPTEPVTYYNSRTRVVTVGPVRRPDNLTVSSYADYIYNEAQKAAEIDWIAPSSGVLNELNAIQSGQVEVSEVLSALRTLKAERGLSVTDEGYYLLKPNLDRLLSELGYTPPRETLFTALKDNILSEGYPNSNEGANPFLTLEEIRGRNTRSVVAFDLTEVDEASLSRATLVLSIDSSQQITGWGNGGTISVRPLTTNWSEGNGSSFSIVRKDALSGEGEGATWQTFLDPDISNNTPDGGESWDGGSLFSESSTAPPVLVTNHSSGDLAFDVTQDVRNGASNGWLILKDVENRGSKVSFYSREGAVVAGDPNLAPRLILEYEGQSAYINMTRLFSLMAMSWDALFNLLPEEPVAMREGLKG